jgi:lipopolysaccharide/colanic/teichoic acid biosynthesis glycosyltransferase
LYRKILKPTGDFIIAITLIIALLPLMGVIAAIITINMGTFPIFSQKRPGMNEEIFCMYKFKTMKDLVSQSEIVDDKIRLTSLGLFLRKYSLDELPELLNILKGEMSLVGPRPLLPEYLQEYTNEQKRRHDVKPGLKLQNDRNAVGYWHMPIREDGILE